MNDNLHSYSIPGAPGYDALQLILADAFAQAANGKGIERHGNGLPFDKQPMQSLADAFGLGFPLGQAAKKLEESQGLPYEHARAELLGAIVYTAGAVLAMDRQRIAAMAAAPTANDNGGPIVAGSVVELAAGEEFRPACRSRFKACGTCLAPMTCLGREYCAGSR